MRSIVLRGSGESSESGIIVVIHRGGGDGESDRDRPSAMGWCGVRGVRGVVCCTMTLDAWARVMLVSHRQQGWYFGRKRTLGLFSRCTGRKAARVGKQ